MSEGQNSNVLKLIVINWVNSWLIKKAMKYFMRPLKEQQRRLTNIISYILFIILLLTFNYFIYKLSSPTNLYDEIGAARRMTADEIKVHIEQIEVETLMKYEGSMLQSLPVLEKLKEAKNILTHSARRLTYDTFGFKGVEYAWAFMSPNFLVNMLIGSAVFYIICLIMNIIGKDNKFMNMKGEIIIIIIAFIWETEVLMHSESRLHPQPDLIDYLFNAFPIFQRREMMKYFITPMSNLLQNFNSLFIYNQAETRLHQLVNWVPPGYFIPIQNYLKQANIKPDENFQESVQVTLKGLEEKIKNWKQEKGNKKPEEVEQTKEQKLKTLELFRSQRNLLKKYLGVEGNGIYKDLKVAQIVNSYCLAR